MLNVQHPLKSSHKGCFSGRDGRHASLPDSSIHANGGEPRRMSLLSDAFSSHTLDSMKMEACMKRRYAIMAAALLHAEDDEPLPDKRKSCILSNGRMQHKGCGIKNQLNEESGWQKDPTPRRGVHVQPEQKLSHPLERLPKGGISPPCEYPFREASTRNMWDNLLPQHLAATHIQLVRT